MLVRQNFLHQILMMTCYLGSILEQNGTSNLEMEKRINYGRKVIGMLNSILWSINILGKTKTLIYK
jgi:hypothetical protein